MTLIFKSYQKDKFTADYLVDEKLDGMRLDQFLLLYFTSATREGIKRKIFQGDVTIKGRPGKVKPSSVLRYPDVVTVFVERTYQENEYWEGKLVELEEEVVTIFEDEELIVMAKPPFMSTHPTGRHLFYCATVYMEAKHQHTIYPIHRLDRETSGTLLLGKNPKINAYFTDLFETTQVHKCYFLIGIKKIPHVKEKFIANERLSSPDHADKIMQVQHYPENSTEGKASQTEFNILYQNEKYVIGLAFPHTGRQHQIRVHALAHGFPLIGDKIYLGGYPMFERFKDNEATTEDCKLLQLPRQALHALAITMMYKKKETTFISPLPHDLQDWIKKNVPDLNFTTFFKTIEEHARSGTKL